MRHTHRGGRAVLLTIHQLFEITQLNARHLDVHVDAVEQRTRDPGPIALNFGGRTVAIARRVALAPAGAGIHGRDELECRGVLSLQCRA
jgi:hypothetical protein